MSRYRMEPGVKSETAPPLDRDVSIMVGVRSPSSAAAANDLPRGGRGYEVGAHDRVPCSRGRLQRLISSSEGQPTTRLRSPPAFCAVEGDDEKT